ncbi:MAG: LemA family protein [Chromatiaceae bacterium]|nr:LemA family protein [Gammaproteobacteria bacterium]MCP5300467.1 LemA family protein [Chromatiaceae bacterium]MCP5422539.1 LemA family protein [Chromatiaceae bacterium]
MEVSTMILIAVVVVVVLYVIVIYNNLVGLKHAVSQAWSNIDVLLKQRHDELPKLVETCKQYMKHERETLEQVMKARSAVASARQAHDIGGLGEAEGMLRLGLGNLFAVAEAYPELKANESFRHLQARITGLENDIADRREFYNASVNANNVRIEQFPDLIVARLLNFAPAELLQFDATEVADVNLGGMFG